MIRLVFVKELVDHLRDRRSASALLVLPAIGPLILLAMFQLIADLQRDRPLVVPVSGAEHAPRLVAHLRANGIETRPPPSDPEHAVMAGQVDMVLIIDEGYAEKVREGKSARARLLVDESQNEPRRNVRRVQQILIGHAQRVGALRLLARGISPDLAVPLAIEAVDLATPEKLATRLLSMIPLFLMLAALVGGMNLAIDTTAGERERGSLEPLLTNPVSRLQLVAGKWLATASASLAGVVLTQVAFAATLSWLPLEDLGMQLSLGWRESAQILATMLPLAFLGASVQMLIATFARSFKEAQTYLSLLTLVPMAPSALLMLRPADSAFWMMPLPALAQVGSVMGVMRGEGLPWLHAAVTWASSAIYCGLCLWGVARLLKNEKIIFGRV